MLIRDVAARPMAAIPLAEVSDLALARPDGAALVIAVGDRSADVAWARVTSDPDSLSWTVEALPADTLGSGAAQLEGIAADGQSRLLLVREWPNEAILVDAPSRHVVGSVSLTLPAGADLGDLGRSWLDPRGSHAEGALLLRDGHLLVVKEKGPAALLEFAPAGSAALGFTEERWLVDGEAWALPAQGALELVAAWHPDAELAGCCPDLSGISEDPNGGLLLLSDQGASIARIAGQPPATAPFEGVLTATVGWRLRGLRGKPEGLAVLPGGDVLIACDRKGIKRNLFSVPATAFVAVG